MRRIVATVALASACGGHAPTPVANPPVAPTTTPTDATCHGRITPAPSPSASVEPAFELAQRPRVALASIDSGSPPLRIAPGAPVDLGSIDARDRSGPALSPIDVSTRSLPRDAVTKGLSADVLAHWNALLDAQDRARGALVSKMRIEAAEHDCAGCAERDCLSRAGSDAMATARDAKSAIERELAWLRARLEKNAPSPEETMVAGLALETIARAGDAEPSATWLAAAIERYAAVATARRADELGAWALYGQARCLSDENRDADARDAYRSLAAASESLRAEALWHVGQLEDDPKRAFAAFADSRAADRDPAKLYFTIASYGELLVAVRFGLPRDVFVAASDLSAAPDFDEEDGKALGWAFDALGGDVPSSAAYPAPIVAFAAAEAALYASERQDEARAERFWRTAIAIDPSSKAAQAASVELARPKSVSIRPRDPAPGITLRMEALASSCDAHGQADVTAVAKGLTITPKDAASRDLAACLTKRAAYFLATDPPVIAFRARVVVR